MDRSTTTRRSGTLGTAAPDFRHEALFYRGRDEFLGGATAFVRDGLEAGAPVLVVVDAPKIDLLRTALGDDAAAVGFAPMDEVGPTPAGSSPPGRSSSTATPGPTACAGSASRSPPAGAATSWRSATATRRCSTSPFRTPAASSCCARTTRTRWPRTSSPAPGTPIRSSPRATSGGPATPTRPMRSRTRSPGRWPSPRPAPRPSPSTRARSRRSAPSCSSGRSSTAWRASRRATS